jgi:hypothetical protein
MAKILFLKQKAFKQVQHCAAILNYYLAASQLSIMKHLLLIVISSCLLFACASRKGYLDRNDADKSLQDAVRKLKKNADDANATEALPPLYKIVQQKHLNTILAYSNSKEINRWDVIIDEYQYLQNAYDAIINSTAAFALVTPQSYTANILACKDSAANEYYDNGLKYLHKSGRNNAQSAYYQFQKALQFIPQFKDAEDQMKVAFENGMINVLINPLEDNSIFNKPSWSNIFNKRSNDYFQQQLLNDLSNSNRYAAVFFKPNEARRVNEDMDWIINTRLKNLDIPLPITNYTQRNVSNQIQIGTDTAGQAVYKTVNATIKTTKYSFGAFADVELSILDLSTNTNIELRNFREDYKWQQETATYFGDKRALSNSDWNIINNSQTTIPRKEEVLLELYKQIYPRLYNQVRKTLQW